MAIPDVCYLYQPNNIFDSHKKILERGAKKLERYFLDDQQWDKSFERTAYDDRQEAYWQEWKSRGRQAQREEADRPDSQTQTPASSSSSKRPASSDPIRDAWVSLVMSFDFAEVERTAGVLMSVCLPTHKFRPADLAVKSVDSLAMCLDSLQEQDQSGLFNPERLRDMLIAQGSEPREQKGSGKAKARTEAPPPKASTPVPPWKSDSKATSSSSKASPVPPVPIGTTNRMADPDAQRYKAVSTPSKGPKAPPTELKEADRKAKQEQESDENPWEGLKPDEGYDVRTHMKKDYIHSQGGKANRFGKETASVASSDAGTAAESPSAASASKRTQSQGTAARRAVRQTPPTRTPPEEKPQRQIPPRHAVKSSAPKKPPFKEEAYAYKQRVNYRADNLTPDELQAQQRRADREAWADIPDSSADERQSVKQELVEDQTATAEYRRRMEETEGLGPIEVEEDGGKGIDYSEVLRKRKDTWPRWTEERSVKGIQTQYTGSSEEILGTYPSLRRRMKGLL